jgi:hypothetical protein
LDVWREVVRAIASSSFCVGQNGRGWRATFDWLVLPDTRVKVLEGKYSGTPHTRASPAVIPRHTTAWADECQELHGGACESRAAHQFAIDKATMVAVRMPT